MTIYDCLLILLLIVCLISTTKLNNRKFEMVIQITFLTLVSGLRYQETLGSDFSAYKRIFENSIYEVNTDFIYWILNFVVRTFTDDFNIFLIIISFIINLLIVVIVNKYSKMPNLSIVIYFIIGGYFGSFNIMRQYLAISLYWMVIYYIFSNNNKKAVIISILSIGIHKSTLIILLITIPIIKLSKNLNKYKLMLLIVLSHIFYFLEPYLKRIIGTLYYNDYLQTEAFNYGASLNLYIFELVIIMFIIFNLKEYFDSYSPYDKFLITNMIPSFILAIIATRGVLYARFMPYFYVYKIVLIPNLLYKKDKKTQSLLLYLCFIFLILYFIVILRPDISVYKNKIHDTFIFNKY